MRFPLWAPFLLLGVALAGCLTDNDGNGGSTTDPPTTGPATTSPRPTGSPTGSPTGTSTSPAPTTPGPSPSNTTSPGPTTSGPTPSPLRPPTTWEVTVQDGPPYFSPDELTIQRHDTVRWKSVGIDRHTITGATGGWDLHPNCTPSTASNRGVDCLDQNEQVSRTFTIVRDELVYCKLHGTASGQAGDMVMRIHVKDRHDDTPT